MKLLRLQTLLASAWLGMIAAIGGLAAPGLFVVLERAVAGKAAGHLFTLEAKVSLAFAILIFAIERRRVRDLAEQGSTKTVLTGNLLLILAVLFLTIFGEFALHPMMEAAKAGQPTNLSFGALHGLSAGLYWLRAALVVCLAWRLTSQTTLFND